MKIKHQKVYLSDNLSDEDDLSKRALSDAAEIQLRAIEAAWDTLSAREKEAVRGLSQGETFEDTARAMGISPRTVQTLLGRARRKIARKHRWITAKEIVTRKLS